MWRNYLPHMQARQTDIEETNTLSFVGSCVRSLHLIVDLWHQEMADKLSIIWLLWYEMRETERQNCVSDLQGTIAVTTEAHVRIRGSLSWWVSRETRVTHHMSPTPAFICTAGGKIPEKCVRLVACMWEVGLLCFLWARVCKLTVEKWSN